MGGYPKHSYNLSRILIDLAPGVWISFVGQTGRKISIFGQEMALNNYKTF